MEASSKSLVGESEKVITHGVVVEDVTKTNAVPLNEMLTVKSKDVTLSDILLPLLRLICDKNPLYLISAMLILYAQTVIFRTGDLSTDTAIPVLVLAAYAVLMTGAAVLIVRFGKVWDDARSIILLLLMLFMVISAGIDGMIINTPQAGRLWLAGGLGLTLGLSELLCRGIKIEIPRLARTVYYLVNILFFGYPWLLAELVIANEKNPIPAIRGMMLFPVVGGLIFLLLLPMIRDNREYRRDNGTPWRWPAFPMVIFAVMGLGIMFRTYLFTISFYGGKGVGPYTRMATGFGLYMLVPFLLTMALLMLEYSLRSTGKKAWVLALLSPLLLPVFALHVPNSADGLLFLSALPGHFRPVSAALVLTLGYYVYTWLRGMRGALVMFFVTLLGMAASQIGFNCYSTLPGPGWSLGVVLVILLAVRAILCRSSLMFALTGIAAVILASGIFIETDFTMMNGIIPAHLLLAVLFLGGVLFDDRFAAQMRLLGAWLLFAFFCGSLIVMASDSASIPAWGPYLHGVTMISLAVVGWIFGDRQYRNALCVMGGLVVLGGSIKGYGIIHRLEFRGAETIFWSLLTFLAALAISLYKGGVFKTHGKTEDNN